MEITTLKVTKETARRVNKAKYTLGLSSVEETINKIFDIAEKIEEEKQ